MTAETPGYYFQILFKAPVGLTLHQNPPVYHHNT